jgi:hypothetical protein
MIWTMQSMQSQHTSSKPFHLLLQELGYKCVEDVYYGDGLKIWTIGNGVWKIEKENEHA